MNLLNNQSHLLLIKMWCECKPKFHSSLYIIFGFYEFETTQRQWKNGSLKIDCQFHVIF